MVLVQPREADLLFSVELYQPLKLQFIIVYFSLHPLCLVSLHFTLSSNCIDDYGYIDSTETFFWRASLF